MASAAWNDPQPGDVCTATDGRQRKVIRIVYCGSGRRSWERHSDRRPGDWIDVIVYEVQGQERSCEESTWANWCRVVVKGGGHYVRNGVDAGQF